MPEVQTSMLEALLLAGRNEEARTVYEQLAADDFAAVPQGYGTVAALAKLAEVCVLLEDRPRALTLYQQLTPYEDRAAVAGLASSCGAVARHLSSLLSRFFPGLAEYG